MEAIMHGGDRLFVHICLLFNLFLKFSIVPKQFMQCVIIPLVKNKSGDMSDVNNYRTISNSTAMSKLFENTIFDSVTNSITSADYQFGFKPSHSTAICTNVFKHVTDYYTERGSYVFACFVDFSKAFDRVNYWKLFHMLLNDGVNKQIVRLLSYWYSNQEACVRWQNCTSAFFTVGNGTRQGGVLSPLMFTRYIKQILGELVRSRVGCNIGGIVFNVLAYADDIVVLAPAWRAMQRLLDILSDEACSINMQCNVDKTVCMVFPPRNRNMQIASTFPSLNIGGLSVQFVHTFKYLGHIINTKRTDDDDIQREICNLFMRTNILARKFRHCSIQVKTILFKSYCICFYDASLWARHSRGKLNKLRSCYNRCIKTFFNYQRNDSMTRILFDLGLYSFETVLSNSCVIFSNQLHACNNQIVQHLL
jgi:hypothetical protein